MRREDSRPVVALQLRLWRSLLIAWVVCLACAVGVPDGVYAESSGDPYADLPLIASIEDVGNDADEAVVFTLDRCTAIRMYGMGQGSQTAMYDYGLIERADTGQVVWQMHVFETVSDGRARNRRLDRAISLPAGAYRLRYRTNATHAFDDWGDNPPSARFWGIALHRDVSRGQSPPTCWEYAEKPETLGWSSRQLDRLIPTLEQMHVAALMVVTDGQVVFEWGNTANNFKAHSMRKSLLSALYGLAIDEGAIMPSETLAALGIDDKTPLTDAEKQATVYDLLKARSGVYIPAAAEAASMQELRPERGSHASGTFWYYNNWDFNALGTIYDQETGETSIYEAFQRRIAEPLGMQDFDTTQLHYSYESKSVHPAYHFRISARDLARFGQLYLQQGSWQSEQIIPTWWVKESTTSYSDTGGAGTYSGYGYLWWIATEDCYGIKQGAYAASGYGGHTLEVLPQINTVIAVRFATDQGRFTPTDDVEVLINKILIASDRVRDPDYATGRCAALCAAGQWRSCYGQLYIEMVGQPAAGRALLIWCSGVVLSLAVLVWQLVHQPPVVWTSCIAWGLVVLVFGPFGLAAYRLSERRSRSVPIWVRAFGASLGCVAGNTLGLVALVATFVTFVSSGSAGPLALLVPFLVGWLVLRAPLVAQARRISYWTALRRTALIELATTIVSVVGIMPVMLLLESRWRPWTNRLGSPLLWLSSLAAAFAGLVVVYPLNLWLVHRGHQIWPFTHAALATQASDDKNTNRADRLGRTGAAQSLPS